MMEKYGVEMSTLPVNEEQVRTLSELCLEANIEFSLPKSSEEAEDMIGSLIEKLASERK